MISKLSNDGHTRKPQYIYGDIMMWGLDDWYRSCWTSAEKTFSHGPLTWFIDMISYKRRTILPVCILPFGFSESDYCSRKGESDDCKCRIRWQVGSSRTTYPCSILYFRNATWRHTLSRDSADEPVGVVDHICQSVVSYHQQQILSASLQRHKCSQWNVLDGSSHNACSHLVKIHTRSTLWNCYKTRYSKGNVQSGPRFLTSFLYSKIAMRFTALCTVVAVAVTSARGVPTANTVQSRDIGISLNLGSIFGGADLSSTNHYGAPIPPWEPGCKPGWYYGPHPGDHPDLPCLGGVCIMTVLPK